MKRKTSDAFVGEFVNTCQCLPTRGLLSVIRLFDSCIINCIKFNSMIYQPYFLYVCANKRKEKKVVKKNDDNIIAVLVYYAYNMIFYDHMNNHRIAIMT